MSIKEEEKHPKTFISYSWSSPEHEMKVLHLAESLVGVGVDVIIDTMGFKGRT